MQERKLQPNHLQQMGQGNQYLLSPIEYPHPEIIHIKLQMSKVQDTTEIKWLEILHSAKL